MTSFKRKTPEEILLSISKLHRGRIKIYIGAVSGSGKTYHMLREGQSLKEQGIDVVICAVSTMQRPETVEQIGDLERVPSIHWLRNGVEQKDLNLEALIQRNPEVVLVDSLAHRNREGAQFATRLEDIKYLVSHGISVITTVNVYELEGFNQIAHKLTGVGCTDVVPLETLELADEVRLIDVSPETVLQRLSEGHLADRKDTTLFKRGNLGVLRELALRLVAEDVNETLEKHREEEGLVGPSGAAERVLVSTQYHWNGSIYIRRGQQIAKRLNGDLMAVCFVNPRNPLTKEAVTFKRAIVKLVEKVDGTFEELPFQSVRSIARQLVHYAVNHNVTRIILGHSKQTRWQEFWRGSVVNGILEHTQNVDVFIVADRADRDGERILPTKRKDTPHKEVYRRLSSKEVDQKIERIKRGKFKVYIGAAPGVGKTYTMLREGNDLMKKGIDAVIGLLETHGRKETMAQVGLLPIVPRNIFDYRGASLEEMDVPAIIARNPEVVLIDELAHTNMPGSRNKKRYEDVLEVLDAGISVISTMNVQHLESLNDAVEQITGVRVRETVPDSILRLTDDLELIDVAPKSLQQRMREGRIYAMDKVDQALGHFFKTGNLIALRELALREIADEVDERLEASERKNSLRGPWRREEVIFVGVTTSSNAERLIRRGFRIAHRLKAPWYVTYINPNPDETDDYCKRIDALRELTTRLGGTFEILPAQHAKQIPPLLVEQANRYKSTQVIIGQSRPNIKDSFGKGSVVQQVLRSARHMDVLVVADFDPNFKNSIR
ncbi:histidine kinase [Paenibacillus sp. N1-5-1-14]|uniref:histidine kinase n=1 Tax=Paenibacillus radicibacter TaxID=2972488 RepID=UPI0021590FBB|nr:histidine kinase [Paenibacillus radicibacter]MCR8644944.1 histidine kinase [Paenibacillus radicibacter]